MVEVFTTQTADVKASVDTTKYDVSSPTVQTDLETDLKAAYCTTARSCTVTVLSYNNVTFNRRQLSAGHRRLASGEVSATTAASYGTDNTVPTAAAKVDGISFMTGTVTGISSITTVSTPPGSSADTSALTSELGNTSSVQAATGYSVTSTGVTAAHASPPPPPSEPPSAPPATPPTDVGVPGGTTTSDALASTAEEGGSVVVAVVIACVVGCVVLALPTAVYCHRRKRCRWRRVTLRAIEKASPRTAEAAVESSSSVQVVQHNGLHELSKEAAEEEAAAHADRDRVEYDDGAPLRI